LDAACKAGDMTACRDIMGKLRPAAERAASAMRRRYMADAA
jgi:hypothetical protein